MPEIFDLLGKNLGLNTKFQWLYRTKNTALWSITDFYKNKIEFDLWIQEYNKFHPRIPIVEFKKVKATKRYSEKMDYD